MRQKVSNGELVPVPFLVHMMPLLTFAFPLTTIILKRLGSLQVRTNGLFDLVCCLSLKFLHLPGIQPCLGNVHPNGTCDAKYGWNDVDFWSTFLSIYRRTATVTADRPSTAILDVSDYGEPINQNITGDDFLIAFKTMLYAYNETNSIGGACPVVGPDFQLTTTMSSLFETSLLAPDVTIPMNILRNLFVTPLFVFNAMVTNYGNFTIDPNAIPTGLPAENYVTGSYARPIIHVVPAAWTVKTYIAVTAFFLLFVIVTFFYTMIKYGFPETSDFPIIDDFRIQNENGGSLRDAFSDAALEDDWKMMKEAADVSIKLGKNVC